MNLSAHSECPRGVWQILLWDLLFDIHLARRDYFDASALRYMPRTAARMFYYYREMPWSALMRGGFDHYVVTQNVDNEMYAADNSGSRHARIIFIIFIPREPQG